MLVLVAFIFHFVQHYVDMMHSLSGPRREAREYFEIESKESFIWYVIVIAFRLFDCGLSILMIAIFCLKPFIRGVTDSHGDERIKEYNVRHICDF